MELLDLLLIPFFQQRLHHVRIALVLRFGQSLYILSETFISKQAGMVFHRSDTISSDSPSSHLLHPGAGEQSVSTFKHSNVEGHVLRIVCRKEGETGVVVTFYPRRREAYTGA